MRQRVMRDVVGQPAPGPETARLGYSAGPEMVRGTSSAGPEVIREDSVHPIRVCPTAWRRRPPGVPTR